MAHLKLTNVSVDFPVYNGTSRSVRNQIFRAVGGTVSQYNDVVNVKALNGVSLELNDGDRLALIGHNGAGKTTMLRVMAGIYPPTGGVIERDGTLASMTDITMGMNAELTGYDNIVTRLVLMGMNFAEAKSHVAEIVEFAELEDYVHLPMRTYSTGMYMRLAFSVATSMVPEILILDEMIGAGDAHFVEKAKRRTQDFLSRSKIMVLASHDAGMLQEYCTRAVWLERGSVKMTGAVDDVLAAYKAAITTGS
jgi:ABC-type polysaccharide/polyol phosphate transport system ATPase subunit